MRQSAGKRPKALPFIVFSALALSVLVVLFFMNPLGNGRGIYPPCLFHAATGLYCPGCGATRAMHRLLHGRMQEAVRYNPLVVLIALPMALWGYLHWTAKILWPGTVRPRGLNPLLSRTLAAIAIAFALLRNLPFEACRYLAPPDAKSTAAPVVSVKTTGAVP